MTRKDVRDDTQEMLSPVRILLVEDNPGDVRLVREMLIEATPQGYVLTPVERISDALARLTKGNYDVILVDLLLPDSQGWDTFARVHTYAPAIPIVVLSGLTDEALAIRAVRRGAQDYLIKGKFDGNLLTRAIHYAMERKRFEVHLEAVVVERTHQLQEALLRAEEASRAKSDFLANMSHELRTPLTLIIGFSEFLKGHNTNTLTETEASYIHTILQSGRHLLNLVNDILDFTSLERGDLWLKLETVNLPAALAAALDNIRPQADAKHIHLSLNVDTCPAALVADPARFGQILGSLLSNAVKFTPEGGHVTLSAQDAPSAKTVEISVRDTGIGIKPADLPKLFQLFTQLDPVSSKRFRGTGLGLTLTQRLVDRHGGRIWAESDGEGCGSTFTVRLPLVSTGVPQTADESLGADPANPR